MNINKLIKEAKERYKVGDRFRVVHDPIEICTIESFDLHDDTIIINPDGSWHFNLLITDAESADSATVCHNGKWAEKVVTKYLADESQVLKLEPYEDDDNSFNMKGEDFL